MALCIIDLDPLAARVARSYLGALSRSAYASAASMAADGRLSREYQRRSDGLEPVGQEDDEQVEGSDDWSTPSGL